MPSHRDGFEAESSVSNTAAVSVILTSTVIITAFLLVFVSAPVAMIHNLGALVGGLLILTAIAYGLYGVVRRV